MLTCVLVPMLTQARPQDTARIAMLERQVEELQQQLQDAQIEMRSCQRPRRSARLARPPLAACDVGGSYETAIQLSDASSASSLSEFNFDM